MSTHQSGSGFAFGDDIKAAYQAIPAPDAPAQQMLDGVLSHVRRRRGRRYLGIAAGLCLAVVLAVVAVHAIRAPRPHVPVTTSPGRTGSLDSGRTASCASGYSRKTLVQREWAVDAVVTDMKISGDSAQVELTVHAWYRGGSTTHATATLPSPWQAEDGPPEYGVGTRLLISGQRDHGAYVGWSCGFTRYYDRATAQQWDRYFG